MPRRSSATAAKREYEASVGRAKSEADRLIAGNKEKLAHGRHTRTAGTIGDLYLTLADDVLNAGLGGFPAASRRLTQILA